MTKRDKMDPQVVEVLGRGHLISELLRAGLEVAEPVRDRGIDLIAYSDLDATLTAFVACPIQMKASAAESFSIDAKYAAFPNLIIAHVWHVNDEEVPITFALTYAESFAVASALGWTETASWAKGYYTSTSATSRAVSAAPYDAGVVANESNGRDCCGSGITCVAAVSRSKDCSLRSLY
jgi:hypothetical protein